ncbi:hypothetical protein JP75_14290 [Devosia riboflavina]|uniref:Uncharacterized protein n=1 Tax=Devosia riboflavina TaxID=46914 RepID=A0A087M187_9HYPH|nr:hypothetical protein [Devosia riboflavina]KFL30640.1 hypothetical protein JP75_14290 [Devosia riboflavina]
MAKKTENKSGIRPEFLVLAVCVVAIGAIAFVSLTRQPPSAPQMTAAEIDKAVQEARQRAEARSLPPMPVPRSDTDFRQATDDELRMGLNQCKDAIAASLKGPYAYYFGKYTPQKLDRLYAAKSALGSTIPRPSSLLDDFGFDDVEHNLALLRSESGERVKPAFVVEHSREGFIVQHYVAVYECERDGKAFPSFEEVRWEQFS